MSDKFKFLSQSSDPSDTNQRSSEQEDAAQSFLDEKLAKNRFSQKQDDPFDYSADTSYSDDDDFVKTAEDAAETAGGGSLAERYKAEFGTDAMKDLQGVGGNTDAANAIFANIRSLDGDDYWKTQDLSSLMKKAGHAETDGIRAGDIAANGGMRVDATLTGGINYDSIQGALSEKGWYNDAVKQNGIAQLGSAMLASGGDEIKHSPEIEQAKERVKTYEDDIISGKTSESIYGVGSNSKANYAFDATKGAAGIGTPMNGDSYNKSIEATENFLDNKKQAIKKEYQFRAQS